MESITEENPHDDTRVAEARAGMLTKEGFLSAIKAFKQVRFDAKMTDTPDAEVRFKTLSQPLYHKNFDLLTQSLHLFMD